MKKMVNGQLVDLTIEEITEKEEQDQLWLDGAFDRAILNLREKRNNLLKDTDYLALSDNTMSESMTTYRQQLRDATNGLTTVAEVEAYTFPTKPE